MYSLKNLGNKNPVQVSTAVMAVVNLPILGKVWEPEAGFVSGLNFALVSILGLFIVSKTVNAGKLEELGTAVAEAADGERAAGFDDAVALAGAIEEQVDGKVADTLEAVAALTVPAPALAGTKKAAARKRTA